MFRHTLSTFIFVIIFVLVMLLSVHISYSATATVYGAGNSSCGEYLSYREKKGCEYYQFSDWLNGFISSYGLYSGKKMKITDSKGMVYWIDNYCKEHPLDEVARAADKLAIELTID